MNYDVIGACGVAREQGGGVCRRWGLIKVAQFDGGCSDERRRRKRLSISPQRGNACMLGLA